MFMSKWLEAQNWELDWHNNCVNSLNEELKQLVYAEKMGLVKSPTPKTSYNFDLKGKSILDIGSGPYSLLLKCSNYSDDTTVSDPLMNDFPKWVRERYAEAKIKRLPLAGEDIKEKEVVYDICLIYNVLQHTINPKGIAKNALEVSREVRVFEWINTVVNVGHPHSLGENKLNEWFAGEGKVENINKNNAVGTAWYGIFKGKHYAFSKG